MTHQASLFGFDSTGAAVAPTASVQSRELARVGGRIDLAIVSWCERHRGVPFRLSSFTADIVAEIQCAPDSPRRRLVALSKMGHVRAICLDRSGSLWVIGEPTT